MKTCDVCGKECKNEHGLQTHKRMVHPPDQVQERKAACSRCGSTDLRARDGAQKTVLDVSGTRPDGTPYNRVVWRRKECAQCGQMVTVRTLENV